MTIAYLLPSLRCTAPIKVIQLLCKEMVNHGHNCTVFYLDSFPKNEELEFPCQVIQTNKSLKELTCNHYDVVHSSGLRPDIYLSLKKNLITSRCISTVHNFYKEDFRSSYGSITTWIFGRIWMKALNSLDRVVTLSNVGVKYYSKWISSEKLTYVYNAIDRSLNYESTKNFLNDPVITEFKKGCKLIGLHAMLTQVKGVDVAIKALQYLPEYKLVVIGDGKERDNLVKLTNELNLSTRVLFLGFKESAWRYLQFYDIYVIPSRSEGFPLVLLEAAQMRVNTVCSDLPIFKEIFTSDDLTYFKKDNPKDLAEKIQEAIRYPSKAISLNIKQSMCYNSEIMYKNYMKFYEQEI